MHRPMSRYFDTVLTWSKRNVSTYVVVVVVAVVAVAAFKVRIIKPVPYLELI